MLISFFSFPLSFALSVSVSVRVSASLHIVPHECTKSCLNIFDVMCCFLKNLCFNLCKMNKRYINKHGVKRIGWAYVYAKMDANVNVFAFEFLYFDVQDSVHAIRFRSNEARNKQTNKQTAQSTHRCEISSCKL